MENVRIYKWAKCANAPHNELQHLYDHCSEIAKKTGAEFVFGHKIKIIFFGYEEAYDYPPYPNHLTLCSSIDIWMKGLEERYERWYASLPDEEEDDEYQLCFDDVRPYAGEMGMDEDEMRMICEDMGIY